MRNLKKWQNLRAISLSLGLLPFYLSGCNAGGRGIDLQFGESGFVSIDFSGGDDQANAVAVASDGSVYLAGSTFISNNDFAIAKLTAGGELDTSFNTSGKASADFGGSDEAFAVLVQTDGKVVAVGQSTTSSITRLSAARWNTNGSLDSSFGVLGRFTTLIGSGTAEYRAAALDSSGRILVAGNAQIAGRQRFVLAALSSSGALDTSFGSFGVSTETPGTLSDTCRSLAISQNRILLGGTKKVGVGTTSGDFAIVAYNSNGAIDTRFGASGIASADSGAAIPPPSGSGERDDAGLTLKADSAGRLLLAGSSQVGAGKKTMAVARFSQLGVLDRTFGRQGFNLIAAQVRNASNVLVPIDTEANSLTFGPSSLLLSGKATALNSSSYLSLSKLTPTGMLTTSFGTSGLALATKGTQSTVGTASALQEDGKWLLAGSAYGTSWDFIAVRYDP